MSKLIAVLCTGEKDFINLISLDSSVIGILNGKAFTNTDKLLLMVDKINCIRGIKLDGYIKTDNFKETEKSRMSLELVNAVTTRIVK